MSFYNSDYLRKLLIERPKIRAKLLNPGGSVILTGTAASTEQTTEYSSQIGSGPHLDLVEMEMQLAELPEEQRNALIAWAEGVTPREAAMYFSAKGAVLRKRRERGVKALADKMNDEGSERNDTGRGSRPNSSKGSSRYRRVL
jgi:DNA-directed RNA polymerase specialized sigma24 family protein